ncbi:MAG: DUF721 domain-containing protein [Victivallaceae bacterium]|nr:DUF721 domain-containing protein [Victivallaceae bacterium]
MSFPRNKIPLLKKRRGIYSLLRAWYGAERADSEIAAHTERVRPLGDILQEVSGDILNADAADFTKLEAVWDAIAGKTVARLARPLECREKVVTLGVRHSALVTELRPSLDLLKERINQELGENFCRDIRLTVG